MRLSQNQNHPLLPGNPPQQHSPGAFPEPPNPMYQQQHYWQQPPRLPRNANHVTNQYVPNSSTDMYSVQPPPPPPPQNSTYVNRTVPEQPPANKLPNQDLYPPAPPSNQISKPPAYSNGTGFMPPVSQYSHPNSSMHARYPSSSASPNMVQNNAHPSVGAPQYNQTSNALPPQNKLGGLPPAAPQSRRLDPDNMPSPVSLSFIILIMCKL